MGFAATAARDAAIPAPVEGMECVTGTGAAMVKWLYFNAAWRHSYAFTPVRTSPNAAVGPTSAATELVVCTAPSVTVDGTTEVEVTFGWYNFIQTVATDLFIMKLYDGPTAGSGTIIGYFLIAPAINAGGGFMRANNTPASGAHTFTARIVRSSGTGTASCNMQGTGNGITVKPFV